MSSPNMPENSLDKPEPHVAGAGAALILLLGINLFNYIDRQILAANLGAIEKDLLPVGGANNKERLGDLAMAFIVAYMIFAPVFAWLADRFPRWRLVGVGVILWSLASGASGLCGTFPELGLPAWLGGAFGFLLLTRCFVGIGEAAYGPVAPDIISDLYPVSRRGQVLSWFYVAIPVGSAIGYAIGGLAGWPAAFYAVVPPGLLLGIYCFYMAEPKRGQSEIAINDTPQQTRRRTRLRDYLILLRTPSYVLDCLGMAAMTFAMGGIAHWMPDYIHDFRGQPDRAQIGVYFGLIVVVSGLAATILGGLAGDWLRPRFAGSYFLVSGIAMLLAFPFFLAVMRTPFPYAWIFIFLACFCLFFNTGPTNTILANVAHPSLRAPGFALNILVIHLLGDAISPKIIGRIADANAVNGRPDMDAGFMSVSWAILLGGALWLAGTPFLARDTARAPYRLDAN